MAIDRVVPNSGDHRDVVDRSCRHGFIRGADIADTITVGIKLVRIVHRHAIVDVVRNVVAVLFPVRCLVLVIGGAIAVGIRGRRQWGVVAGIANPVTVGIGLVRVAYGRAVVGVVNRAIAIAIGGQGGVRDPELGRRTGFDGGVGNVR